MAEGQPIIVKKIKKGGGDGHHGGAWKVAYADFVTAMMAFFLLMWLLNATSEDQRKGLADFFDPSLPVSRVSAGGAGMLGGEDVFVPQDSAGTRKEGERPKPTHNERGEDLGDLDASPTGSEGEIAPNTQPIPGAPDADAEARIAAAPEASDDADGATIGAKALFDTEGEALLGVAAGLQEGLQAMGGDGLLEHFSFRMTPEGLVIEIADITGKPLFRSGSAQPASILTTLTDILVPVLETTRNDIAIAGHTDASPFTSRRDYSNWELSSDRANAARRMMSERGLDADRIVRVSGRAATDPIDADPFASRNRRIAVTILRTAP
ncbi:MAG: flagellar motor protein MotB [Paracoccaceae bacterium]